MTHYPTLSKTKTSLYAGLSSKKMREKHGLFIVEGEKSVSDLLDRFELEALISLCEDSEAVRRCPVPEKVWLTDQSGMKKLSSLSTPPGVIAVFRLPEPPSAGLSLPEGEEGLYLLLDGVQDPGNLGTIIRTAHWFGFRTIFASRDTADLYNPKTIQATMGSLGRVEVIYTDLLSLVDAHPDMDVYGLLLDGKNINEAPLGKSGFIVMGNEGNGISAAMRRRVTMPLLIPPYDPADHGESLNVAIATAITLADFRR